MKSNISLKRTTLCIVIAALFLAGTAHAQEITPEAQNVFDRHVEALGGEENLKAIKTVKISGSFSMAAMGISAKSIMIQKEPNLFYVEQDIPGMGKMKQGYDGNRGWASDPMQGTRAITGPELEELLENNDIHSDLNMADRYESAQVLPSEGELSVRVSGKRKRNGSTDTLYFSKESGLLLRMETTSITPQGTLPMSIILGDYVERSNVKMPVSLTMTTGGMEIVMTFESVELNSEIPDTVFAYPN